MAFDEAEVLREFIREITLRIERAFDKWGADLRRETVAIREETRAIRAETREHRKESRRRLSVSPTGRALACRSSGAT